MKYFNTLPLKSLWWSNRGQICAGTHTVSSKTFFQAPSPAGTLESQGSCWSSENSMEEQIFKIKKYTHKIMKAVISLYIADISRILWGGVLGKIFFLQTSWNLSKIGIETEISKWLSQGGGHNVISFLRRCRISIIRSLFQICNKSISVRSQFCLVPAEAGPDCHWTAGTKWPSDPGRSSEREGRKQAYYRQHTCQC